MPENGDICNRFGVYKNLCCGKEIVIVQGSVFPDCPQHPKLTTKWRAVADDEIKHVSAYVRKPKKTDAAA